jgi:hypothetical protein
MSAIPPAERGEHLAAIEEVFGAVREIREIPKERLCCPFFGFTLRVEPERGALWLSLTGREGVKPFIRAEIGQALDPEAARAAGFKL